MDDRETAGAPEDGTGRAVPAADALIVVDPVAVHDESGDEPPTLIRRANVGRASAPTVAPLEPLPEGVRTAPTTYRAGQVSTTAPGADHTAVSHPAGEPGELPLRTPGQARIEADSPWEAFGGSPQEPSLESAPSVGEPAASGVARARASVPGAAPVTVADMIDAVRPGPTGPRTYRAGATGTARSPAEPPPPVEPPPPPEPPEPVSPPEPPSPPQPVEPPPGPSPFPSPTPVPTPPRPVPPEPPAPEPEPGPPYPPTPPLPPPPVPPGPSPIPPFPPPPPAIAEEVPSPALPPWPPSVLSGSPFPTSAPPASGVPAGRSTYGPYDGWALQEHPHGRVYSGSPVTSQPLTINPAEQSGSLTGHILSQGTDAPAPKSRTTRVVVIMTVVMAVLVITGLTVAIFARNALVGILKGG